MRYFRYPNTEKNMKNALKEQYRNLTANEKRITRKEKRWKKFATALFFIIFLSCTVPGLFLIRSIPMPDAWFLKALVGVGKVILGLLLLIACGVIAAGSTMPLWKKGESFHIPFMQKEILSKACSHLREYYRLQEPYIITKCFDATDKRFQDHDVCIFIAGDELRITTDLVHGFLHGERDLGCYAFKQKEISIFSLRSEERQIAELRTSRSIFLLGYRAKRFVEKHFLEKAIP